jgi:hypothetical protein
MVSVGIAALSCGTWISWPARSFRIATEEAETAPFTGPPAPTAGPISRRPHLTLMQFG